MWDDILKFLNDNKDALGWLFGSGIVLAVLGGIYRFSLWLIRENRIRRIRTNENFPFKIIPPNSNVAKEILGGADDDPLADRNIPYQQRIQGRNTRRELEELIEDNRWILIAGRTGLGKTREAVQLAKSLNNEGWTVLYLTREAWLDAPAKLPNNVPERKLLFFLDDLNKKCFSSKAETRPNASESLTLPIYEPFQTRLQRTLEAFDTFCGKSEIRVVATARNERISEFDEPSEWDKLGWIKYHSLWEKFRLIDLPEPDKTAEEKLLAETAVKADISIKSDELSTLVKRNDGTFRNIVENLFSVKVEGVMLSSENFRDTLKGTWQKRFQKAMQNYPEAKYIYDAIELLRDIGIQLRFSTVIQVLQIIRNEHLLQRIRSRWKYSVVLEQLIKSENILNPRDGQIEAKGYQLESQEHAIKLYKQVFIGYYRYRRNSLLSLLPRIFGFIHLSLLPASVLNPFKAMGPIEKIIFSVASVEMTFYFLGNAYSYFGLHYISQGFYKKAIEIDDHDPTNWGGLGDAYFNLGQHDAAINAYKKVVENERKGLFNRIFLRFFKIIVLLAWSDLGKVYSTIGRYDEAINAYKKAIEISQTDLFTRIFFRNIETTMWKIIGKVYIESKQYSEGVKAYQKAAKLSPGDEDPWYHLGTTYSIMNDFENALPAFQKAVELSPQDAINQSALISTLRRLGNEVEAKQQEKIARPLVEKESEYIRACFESICGNTDESLRFLKITLEQKQIDLDEVWQDPDFDFIRDDPRFKEIVGLE